MFAEDIVMRSERGEQLEEHPERWRFGRERTGAKASRQRTEDLWMR